MPESASRRKKETILLKDRPGKEAGVTHFKKREGRPQENRKRAIRGKRKNEGPEGPESRGERGNKASKGNWNRPIAKDKRMGRGAGYSAESRRSALSLPTRKRPTDQKTTAPGGGKREKDLTTNPEAERKLRATPPQICGQREGGE